MSVAVTTGRSSSVRLGGRRAAGRGSARRSAGGRRRTPVAATSATTSDDHTGTHAGRNGAARTAIPGRRGAAGYAAGQPPANGGSASTTEPVRSGTDPCGAGPDRAGRPPGTSSGPAPARTSRRRGARARAAASSSARVGAASNDSSATPAACLAAAQYRSVTAAAAVVRTGHRPRPARTAPRTQAAIRPSAPAPIAASAWPNPGSIHSSPSASRPPRRARARGRAGSTGRCRRARRAAASARSGRRPRAAPRAAGPSAPTPIRVPSTDPGQQPPGRPLDHVVQAPHRRGAPVEPAGRPADRDHGVRRRGSSAACRTTTDAAHREADGGHLRRTRAAGPSCTAASRSQHLRGRRPCCAPPDAPVPAEVERHHRARVDATASTEATRPVPAERHDPVKPCATTYSEVAGPPSPGRRTRALTPGPRPRSAASAPRTSRFGSATTSAILTPGIRAMTPPGPFMLSRASTGTAPRARPEHRLDRRRTPVSQLLLLTNALQPSAEVLPALGLLAHQVRVAAGRGRRALLDAPPGDAILVDGRRDLPHVRGLCRLLRTTGVDVPCCWSSPRAAWSRSPPTGASTTCVLDTAGPAEVEARLRLAAGRLARRARRRRRRARRDPRRRPRHRRGHLHRPAPRPGPRPHVQGVRAAQVPRAAPGPGLHPRPAAAGGLGLRLLRRHPHRRRPRPPAARQARPRARGADRHRPQRRLPLRRPAPPTRGVERAGPGRRLPDRRH